MGKAGRPSKYTQKIADEICEQLSIGYSIRTVCKPDRMPSIQTFFSWLRTYPTFLEQYTRAKQEAADAMAEDLLDIADDGSNDTYWDETTKKYKTDWDVIGRSKLRVDTRKFLMAKMKPKKYGEKLDIETTGEITHKYEDMTDDELERVIKARQDRLS